MQQFLGDESEESVRKSELKSILAAAFWGFSLGGLVGWVIAGYVGFLFGLFTGAVSLSLFSMLGVRATRRATASKRQSGATPSQPGAGAVRRSPGRPH
jgi:hypothetical protein